MRRQEHEQGDPGERNVAFRKLLGRFIDVCNAIAYAHSRGVLHRDLKPGNIMLGKYGETLVVDWGMAKATGSKPWGVMRGEPGASASGGPTTRSEAPLAPASASDGAETVAGSAFGTPAFMSPEQAAGRLDLLSPASDVYSLGATLYCVLTGRAPFEEKDAGQVLNQVEQGEFPRPRQVKPEVPAPLEAVCLKAMSRNPAGRYSSTRELAEEIERWLADEPVAALAEPVAVRARRWMRRHRPLVTGMAAALVVGVVSLGVAALALSAKNTELASANATIGKVNDSLKKSVASETAAREDAQKSEKLAAEQRTLALQTLKLVVSDIDVQLKNKPALQELRQKLLDKALEGLKKVARSADNSQTIDHQTVWVHFELGELFLTLEGAGVDQAHKQYQQAHAIAVQRATADPKDRQVQRDLSISFERLGIVSLQLGQVQAAKDHYQRGLDIRKKRAAADPKDSEAQSDLSSSFLRLGDVSLQLGQVEAAKDYYKDCLDISKRRAAAHWRRITPSSCLTCTDWSGSRPPS
jgi:tetratricopeptide (TPR) repeat protein